MASPKGVGYRTADYTTVLELVTFHGQFPLILFHEMMRLTSSARKPKVVLPGPW